MSTVLFGFTALAIDVGAMYTAQSELQRAADAAVMAATAKLSDFSTGDPQSLARAAAVDYACRNAVLNGCTVLDPNADVVFGRGNFDSNTGLYSFSTTTATPDAVRITLRRDTGSASGPMPLYFARVLGHATHDMTASATAVLVPRDIAIVADLSASHTDDSELRHYKMTDINLWDVWDAMPGGLDGGGVANNPPPGWDPTLPANVNMSGPTFGSFMDSKGWGTTTLDSNYDPTSDDGLIYLPYGQSWSSTAAAQNSLLAQGYIQAEVDALLAPTYDGSQSSRAVWENRTAVVLGLAEWNSGFSGGRWQQLGQSQVGNGNTFVGSGEVSFQSYPYAQGSWRQWIDNYTGRRYTAMARANSNFRYRFGVKTFMNYLLEYRPRNAQTPELAGTPTQPMQAVKDAVEFMMNYLGTLDSEDFVSLEIYARTTNHEIDLTQNYTSVSDRLLAMQGGYYDTWTNMAGGIVEGIQELTGANARPNARKVMILLTDGNPNTDLNGNWNVSLATQQSLDQAAIAVAQGIKIYAVSVGAAADTNLMQQIADIGEGEHFWATGTIDQYSAQLEAIFESLGGERPVVLIE